MPSRMLRGPKAVLGVVIPGKSAFLSSSLGQKRPFHTISESRGGILSVKDKRRSSSSKTILYLLKDYSQWLQPSSLRWVAVQG